MCMSVIENGFMFVMMDGLFEEDGKMFVSYDYNVKVMVEVVCLVYVKGVLVEGELGCFGLLEMGMGDKEDGYGVEGKFSYD